MFRAHKVFLATGYPQRELVGTMKRLLACLVLCASLSASAQDDNCTVLGIQELTELVISLQSQLQAQSIMIDSLSSVAMTRDSVQNIWRGYTAIASQLSLNKADLAFLVRPHLYLSDATLLEANFRGAYLRNADFGAANMNLGNFSYADLQAVDMTYGSFQNCNFDHSWMKWAQLQGANISGASFRCLKHCPENLPNGYDCLDDPECSEAGRFRVVPN